MHVVLLPFQGVVTIRFHTQGAALGYMLLPFQGVFLLVEYELCIYLRNAGS